MSSLTCSPSYDFFPPHSWGHDWLPPFFKPPLMRTRFSIVQFHRSWHLGKNCRRWSKKVTQIGFLLQKAHKFLSMHLFSWCFTHCFAYKRSMTYWLPSCFFNSSGIWELHLVLHLVWISAVWQQLLFISCSESLSSYSHLTDPSCRVLHGLIPGDPAAAPPGGQGGASLWSPSRPVVSSRCLTAQCPSTMRPGAREGHLSRGCPRSSMMKPSSFPWDSPRGASDVPSEVKGHCSVHVELVFLWSVAVLWGVMTLRQEGGNIP